MRALWPLALPLLGLSLGVRGHTEALVTSGGVTSPLSWAAGAAVTYHLNNQTGPSLPNLVPGSNPAGAVDAAFATVQTATGVPLVNGGTVATASVGTDGLNLVTFASTSTNLAVVGGAVAVTVLTFNTSSFQILEADVAFNPAVQFSTLGTSNAQDLQSVAVHEVGHLMGQKHSPLLQATMFPFNGNGRTGNRSLSEDDRAGLRTLYPGATGALFATVTGTVQRSAIQPVSGAHVVLQDVITGRAVTGGVTLPSGGFSIGGVPPGIYHLYAEPLDGPFPATALSGGIWDPTGMDTTFRTAVLGGSTNPSILPVLPGQTVSAGTLTVSGPTPVLNATGASLTSLPNGFSAFSGLPQTLAPPYSQYLAIGGAGANLLPDAAFALEGPFLSITGPSTASGTLSGGTGWKIFPISVSAATPSGGYSIRLRDLSTGELAFMSGAVDVTAAGAPQAYALSYLTSCPGGSGPVTLSAASPPFVGNGAFALSLSGTSGGQTGYLLLSLRPHYLPVLPGCAAVVDLGGLVIPFPGLPFPLSGPSTTVPAPIPGDPGLAGRDLFVQIVVTDPAAPAGVGLSNGLALHLE